jgi:hypothetical protein
LTDDLALTGQLSILKDLHVYSFNIQGSTVRGLLTDAQAKILGQHTGSLNDFFEAVANVFQHAFRGFFNARDALRDSLFPAHLRMVRKQGQLGITSVSCKGPCGCCTLASGAVSCAPSKTYCENIMKGQWSNPPCMGSGSARATSGKGGRSRLGRSGTSRIRGKRH